MICLKNIVKIYNRKSSQPTRALDGVDLVINSGEMLAIMGVSGSGKSTLLNIIGCLDKATDGEYILDGKNINEYKSKEIYVLRNKKFGFILQNYGLVEDKSVLTNVMYPLAFSKDVGYFKMKGLAKKAIKNAGIGELTRKKVSKISGGQKQRAAIARAIVNSPEVILADEPTAALDHKTADEIMGLLKELNKNGTTIIVVTHDKRIADMCDRIVYISDGRISEDSK